MNEWVQNPTAHTALDDILPCVDNATAQETLTQSKNVAFQLVDVVNNVITGIANGNFPPSAGAPFYFNQSGPSMPILCNPFYSNLTDRLCASGEVELGNATVVRNFFIAQVPFCVIITLQRVDCHILLKVCVLSSFCWNMLSSALNQQAQGLTILYKHSKVSFILLTLLARLRSLLFTFSRSLYVYFTTVFMVHFSYIFMPVSKVVP